MKTIQLTQGKVALVDDEDFDYLNQWKWHYSQGYAARSIILNGKKTSRLMHRDILGLSNGEFADHINLNKLDNRRINIRKCSLAENNRNISKSSRNTSGFKGVSKYYSKWRAQIRMDNLTFYLGDYNSPKEAALVYDAAAKEMHGPFANLNFPAGKE